MSKQYNVAVAGATGAVGGGTILNSPYGQISG